MKNQLHKEKTFSFPSETGRVQEYVDIILAEMGEITEDTRGELMFCLTETLSNAIIHGNFGISSEIKRNGFEGVGLFYEAVAICESNPEFFEKIVEVTLQIQNAIARITVTDQGKGFDHRAIMSDETMDNEDDLASFGNGLRLMKEQVGELAFSEAGNSITFAKNLGTSIAEIKEAA